MRKTGFLWMLALVPATALAALAAEGFGYFTLFGQGKRLAGLLGLALLGIQLLLSARVPFFERRAGQDGLIAVHRTVGIAGFVLVFVHSLLDPIGQLVSWGAIYFELPADVPKLGGIVAMLLLFAVALPAVFRSAWKIRYDTWKRIHRLSYVLLPLVLVHSFVLGTTVRSQPLGMGFWILSALCYTAAVGWRLIVRARSARRPCRVESVERITHDTVRISFSGQAAPHDAGQFAFVRPTIDGKKLPAHPFTLCGAADASGIRRIAVKKVGRFTEKIHTIAPGALLRVEGPYGVFTYRRCTARRLLFIAGGIGITPFVAMLEDLSHHDPSRPAALVWGNKLPEDAGFQDDLAAFKRAMPNLSIVHVFSDAGFDPHSESARAAEKTGRAAAGFVDARLLASEGLTAHPEETCAMICGPPPMLAAVRGVLREAGFAKGSILFERFSFP